MDNYISIRLRPPLSEESVKNLKVGEMVLIDGLVFTARDKMHKLLVNRSHDIKDLPFDLKDGIVYHCGPIIKKDNSSFKVISAGPTTSLRLEMYEADFIKKYGIRGIIGKGGLGDKTLKALKEYGCVYFQTVGGASAYLAERIKKVIGVWRLEEFGMAEAMWCFEVENFPAIVTMDCHGNSLHKEVEKSALKRFKELLAGEK
jgi:tartrate/fumarate subfamily iron-sulfur-dependent hydro-lyase beta chain